MKRGRPQRVREREAGRPGEVRVAGADERAARDRPNVAGEVGQPGDAPLTVPVHCDGTFVAPVITQLFDPAMLVPFTHMNSPASARITLGPPVAVHDDDVVVHLDALELVEQPEHRARARVP